MRHIFILTKQHRAALTVGLASPGWQWEHPRQRRMAFDLERSGLVRWTAATGWRCRTTTAGQLALRAKPPKALWSPSPIGPETAQIDREDAAHGARVQLAHVVPKIGDEKGHMTCFVMRDGWTALADAPRSEIDKMRLPDLLHLGLTIADLDATALASKGAR